MADNAHWSFDAEPQAAREARQAIRALAVRHRACAEVQDAMALCVTEAVTNAVVHGYRDGRRPGRVELETERVEGAIWVRVRDDGSGIAPRSDTPGLGFGLPLMANLADEFEARTASTGGTEIVLRFVL